MKNTAPDVRAAGVRGLQASPRERRRGVSPEHGQCYAIADHFICRGFLVRQPIKTPAGLSRLPIEALQGGKAGNSAASLYNTPEAKVTRGFGL